MDSHTLAGYYPEAKRLFGDGAMFRRPVVQSVNNCAKMLIAVKCLSRKGFVRVVVIYPIRKFYI